MRAKVERVSKYYYFDRVTNYIGLRLLVQMWDRWIDRYTDRHSEGEGGMGRHVRGGRGREWKGEGV